MVQVSFDSAVISYSQLLKAAKAAGFGVSVSIPIPDHEGMVRCLKPFNTDNDA